jgi:P-type Ca2+ transporter type 2C
VGIAMGISGTEITKQAADIVLANDNFTTIEAAVEEGRRVYDNIQKFVLYLLSCNLAEILVMLISISIGVELPFTAMMILFANIFADIPPSMAIGLEKVEGDIMERSPRSTKEGVITLMTGSLIIYQSSVMASITLAIYLSQLYVQDGTLYGPENFEAQTMALMLLTTMQLFQSFMSRSIESSLFKVGLFGNPYMVGAFIFSYISMLMAIFIPGIFTCCSMTPAKR